MAEPNPLWNFTPGSQFFFQAAHSTGEKDRLQVIIDHRIKYNTLSKTPLNAIKET
jgi:hypothetical protein